MGSAQSTSNTQDPWWPIENNDFILEQPTNNLLINNNNSNENIKENENIKNNIVNNLKNCTDQSVSNNQSDKKSHLSEIDKVSLTKFDNLNTKQSEEIFDEASGNYSGGTSSRVGRDSGEQSLEEFKEELRLKRMARQSAIDDLRSEINRLRGQLTEERDLTRRLRNGDESCEIKTQDIGIGTNLEDLNGNTEDQPNVGNDKIRNLQTQLAETQFSLQLANAENLSLNTELDIAKKQIVSLKDVITCSKQVIEVREDQVTQLKGKLTEIENSLAEREMKILSDDLRKEYDKQLENIRNLRQLYEERARVSAAERENLERQISIKKDELTSENEKNKHLEERISTLETDLQNIENDMKNKKSECSRYTYENRELKEEMAVINKLFSQTLIGFNGTNCLDIDRLTTMLEENRTLLNEMATKETKYEGASLPKLLFELVKQANNTNELTDNETSSLSSSEINTKEFLNDENSLSNIENRNINNEIIVKNMEGNEILLNDSENIVATSTETPLLGVINDGKEEIVENVASAQEIIGNLPKVWRVLMELLNHQKINQVEIIENGQSEDCYKSVQTPNGPKAEISVSKTYIKLKDLILEKKSLLKETTRLKTLNCHLENRLNHQEKRLSTVSLELTKTWHLVGKMQRQHRQLHTHEQILRYQLQQKRRLLNELKEELEYCRKKWAAARAKNDESQLQCNDMRREFAKRKLEDANNSAESGYSDGPASDEDDNTAVNTSISNKSYEELFTNGKKIERMNSTTPLGSKWEGYLPRSQSVPTNMLLLDNIVRAIETEQKGAVELPPNAAGSSKHGAIPKQSTKKSKDDSSLLDSVSNGETSADPKRTDRTHRINRLEEQCKSLIAQVLQTSNCREKLEVQLCRFQDEMPPVQHPIPLEEFIAKRRHSKSPSPNNDIEIEKNSNENGLTAREEEYTRKRSERIQRLEDESKLLMSRIKRTTVRGNNMKSLLDHIHARCVSSREGSFDSNLDESEKPSRDISTTEELSKTEDSTTDDESTENIEESSQSASACLSSNEEAYTHRRSERLRRLEEESKSLLLRLAKNSERGSNINTKLNYLHNRYGSEDSDTEVSRTTNNSEPSNKSESIIEGSSTEVTIENRLKVVDDAAVKRSERLKLLEEESQKLLTKLSNTSERGTEMLDRLDQNRKRKDEAIRKKDEEKLELEESIRISAEAEKLIREQNVAMSSIVPEQTGEFAIITQTASQIAQSRGARPKQPPPKPTGIAALQLSCSKKRQSTIKNDSKKHEETLEEMFLRLSGGAPAVNGANKVKKEEDAKNDTNENDNNKDKDCTD